MEAYIGERGSGKTAKAVILSNEKGFRIVVVNHRYKKYVEQVANELNLKIPEPLVWDEVRGKSIGDHRNLIIDDLDYLLKYIFGNENISYFTSTEDISINYITKGEK